MNGSSGTEVWAAGDAYEQYVGRWSRLVGEAFLDWLQVPAGRRWLDWDAATALDAAACKLDEGVRFPICRPEPLADLLRAAGLETVETTAIDVPTVFADFDDYWSPFLGGQGPAPGYCMSLAEEPRARLRERLRQVLPTGPDGRISLLARAWAVRGTVAQS